MTSEQLEQVAAGVSSPIAELMDPEQFVHYCIAKLHAEGRLPVSTCVIIPAKWGMQQ